jgi:predicted transcriptional regulator of viral defense system
MPHELPPSCRDLVDLQCGVISRQQAILGGMDTDAVARLVRSGRWQRLQRGSYAVFTGAPTREARLWAALHGAGPGAVLSHQTAAELFRLIDQPSSLIHVTVPAPRHIDRATGVIIHRSARLDDARHPSLLPPRTRIEETVLDLV